MATATDDEFHRRARWVAAYLATHGRTPPLTGDTEEREYASWLATARSRARRGQLPEDRVAILDTEVPGWRPTGPIGTGSLIARARICRDFHDRTGRWPTPGATDPEERALGIWRGNLRSATPERQAVVDDIAPGWRGARRQPVAQRDAAFAVRARAAGRFHAARGRWPSTLSVDVAEARLGVWWVKARSVTPPGSPRGAILDDACPGWREGAAERDAAWADWVQRLARYRALHGSWPRANPPAADERALGRWLVRQRQAGDQLDSERRAQLDAQCPGWEVSGRRRFNERVGELGSFVNVHGRWPSTTSQDQAEVSLAWWHLRQRKGSLSAEKAAALDEAAPGWSDRERAEPAALSRPLGVRFTRFAEELEQFCAQHHRPPHPAGLDARERSMAATLARHRGNPNLSRECRWVLGRCCPGWDKPPAKALRSGSKPAPAAQAHRSAGAAQTTFDEGVAALGAFFGRHLRQPSLSGDREESRLARWLAGQRIADLTPTQQDQLTTACPGWRARHGRWRFESFADQCALFVERHGRWPSMADIADLPGLVWWYGKLWRVNDPDRVAYLDKVVPGWREPSA